MYDPQEVDFFQRDTFGICYLSPKLELVGSSAQRLSFKADDLLDMMLKHHDTASNYEFEHILEVSKSLCELRRSTQNFREKMNGAFQEGGVACKETYAPVEGSDTQIRLTSCGIDDGGRKTFDGSNQVEHIFDRNGANGLKPKELDRFVNFVMSNHVWNGELGRLGPRGTSSAAKSQRWRNILTEKCMVYGRQRMWAVFKMLRSKGICRTQKDFGIKPVKDPGSKRKIGLQDLEKNDFVITEGMSTEQQAAVEENLEAVRPLFNKLEIVWSSICDPESSDPWVMSDHISLDPESDVCNGLQVPATFYETTAPTPSPTAERASFNWRE